MVSIISIVKFILFENNNLDTNGILTLNKHIFIINNIRSFIY